MSLKIGLVYDLRTDYLAEGFTDEQVAEFDTESTVGALETTIRSLGYQVERVGHGRALAARLVAGARWDLVFNIAEGLAGRSREAQVPGLLEMYNIPYTFSDPLVCAVTLDKSAAKKIVHFAGLATPAFQVVAALADAERVSLAYPLFAKPLAEGTGKGVDERSRIDTPQQLRDCCRQLLEKFRQPVLVEEYLPGREFTTAILGTGAEAAVLGTMEVEILPHAGTAVYSYVNKEKCDDLVRYSRPPEGPLKTAVEELARRSYQALECRDCGRVDVRCDGRGRPSFIEVNPLPGLHPQHSDLPMIATQEGMDYAKLLSSIINSARARVGPGTAAESSSRRGHDT